MRIIAAITLPYPACSTQSRLLLADLEHWQVITCKFIRWHLKALGMCARGISSISIGILPAGEGD